MLEVADALAIVLEHARPREPRLEPLSPGLLNRFLAVDLVANHDSPPFDKSLRDGYALRSANYGSELIVIEEIAAGAVPTKAVGRGECSRIFTGAPVPAGADAVVMQEDVELVGELIRITGGGVKPGQWVFPRGAEMKAGESVFTAGTKLNAAAIGVLANLGAAEVPVFPWPQVSVLATGDELVPVDAEPGPGQIRNSNGSMLAAQVCNAGGEVQDCGIVRDTESDMLDIIGSVLAQSDVLLLAGGVSAGKFDLVPGVLERLGVKAHFHKVRMKPGKPLLFGTFHDTLVFGLPGNPVSAFVCFELFVRPALRKMAGEPAAGIQTATMPLAEAIAEVNDRPTYRPAKVEGGTLRPLPWAGAPDLRAMATADALLVLPAGESRLDRGMPANAILI
ncbi:MAG: gephyrin-like molybdotransferase Glp [Gemmataceae bacterium]